MTIALTDAPQKLCVVANVCDASLSGWLIFTNDRVTKRTGTQGTASGHEMFLVCTSEKCTEHGQLTTKCGVPRKWFYLPVALRRYCAWWSWHDRRCPCPLASTVATSCIHTEYFHCSLPTRTGRCHRWGRPDHWKGGCLSKGNRFEDTVKWRCW